jgi:nucleotide-binding universal stress UspA family protein
MKNVLLLIHDDDGQEARLQVALDVTRALSGHLTCLEVFVPPVVVSDYAGVADLAVLAEFRDQEGRTLAALRARLAREDVSWDLVEACGDPAVEIRNVAGLADLIVVTSHSDQSEGVDALRVAAELAAKADRPVLAVPPGCTSLDAGGRALVAWDGSPESDAALRSALPLLQLASSVTLIEVARPDDHPLTDEAASYLSRHGIHARAVEKVTDEPVADAILKRARDVGAAYIVMGAFGHARMTEALFGGVSRTMLQRSEIPLLLTH